MPAIKREILYFEKPGPSNTTTLIGIVDQRIGIGDVKVVVVPVTTGKTADMFSLRDRAEIVRVSEDEAASAAGSSLRPGDPWRAGMS